MQNDPAIDQRLTQLEIKATYTEDLIEQLEQIIVQQQQQIGLLLREVAELRLPLPTAAWVLRAACVMTCHHTFRPY